MKNFIKGIIILCLSLIVFTFVNIIGFLYFIGYSIVTYSSFKTFILLWIKYIDNILSNLGFILYQIGVGYDMIGNVMAGELLEDFVSHKSDSHFGEKDITVSASIGELELKTELDPNYKSKKGRFLSKLLNIVFWQKRHCIDSWLYEKGRREIKEQLFEKLK